MLIVGLLCCIRMGLLILGEMISWEQGEMEDGLFLGLFILPQISMWRLIFMEVGRSLLFPWELLLVFLKDFLFGVKN